MSEKIAIPACGNLVCTGESGGCTLAKIFKNMKENGCTPEDFRSTEKEYLVDCNNPSEALEALDKNAS